MANEEVKVNETKKTNTNQNQGGHNKNFKRNRKPREKVLNGQVIEMKRVTKVTKGGRTMRLSVTYAVGNGKGLVGIGTGKAKEYADAVKKAENAANKNLINVPLVDNRTIPHDTTGKCGKATVLLKKARPGTGVIAGGTARIILELAGVKDVVSKSLGSNTKLNVAKATIDALLCLRTKEQIASLRDKKVEEI